MTLNDVRNKYLQELQDECCRLVPAEAVERAYKEGIERVSDRASIAYVNEFWNNSRAKKVMKGEL